MGRREGGRQLKKVPVCLRSNAITYGVVGNVVGIVGVGLVTTSGGP